MSICNRIEFCSGKGSIGIVDIYSVHPPIEIWKIFARWQYQKLAFQQNVTSRPFSGCDLSSFCIVYAGVIDQFFSKIASEINQWRWFIDVNLGDCQQESKHSMWPIFCVPSTLKAGWWASLFCEVTAHNIFNDCPWPQDISTTCSSSFWFRHSRSAFLFLSPSDGSFYMLTWA